MRTTTDGLRSVKRYVSLALGPDWEVRLSNEKGAFRRPFARVLLLPGITFPAQSFVVVKVIATMQIVAFPKRGVSPDASQLAAMDVVEQLWVAFGGPGVAEGHIYRVPLYDYAGVPISGPDSGVDETHRQPHDYMRVEAPPSVDPNVDPDDDSLWSVTANIRMSWVRSAAVPSTAMTTDRVGVEATETNG